MLVKFFIQLREKHLLFIHYDCHVYFQIIVIKAQLDAIKTLEPVHQEFLKRRQRRKTNSACGVNNASSMGKEVLRRLENCIL